MRTIIRILLVSTVALFLSAATAPASPVEVSISVFHDQLAPHGRWVTAHSYGSVWIPGGVAAGWQPYVDGEWAYTDYGWTWQTDDPWGDAPYHYGTWAWVDPYGWVWIPGTVWAPAWVTWAYTDDYVGWAPVPPSFALTATGYFGPAVVVPAARYVFVPAPKFIGVRVASVRVPAAQSAVIVSRAVRTTRFEVQSGIVRVAGPPPQKIERAVGRPLERVSVERLHVRPTTVSAGGVSNVKSVRVVAPEKDRARLAASEKAPAHPAATERESARPETKAASKAPPKRTNTEANHAAKESRHIESQPASTEHKAKASAEPKAKERHPVKPEKAPVKPEKASVEPSHAKKTSTERVDAPAKPQKVEPGPEAKRPEAQSRPRPEVQPKTQAAPHPAPQAKERPQPKENPKPPKDDGSGN